MEKFLHALAPGKILWLGGYSVLDRPNISFSTTIDSFVHFKIRQLKDNTIKIAAPQFNFKGKGEVDLNSGRIEMGMLQDLALLKTSIEVSLGYLRAIGEKINGMEIVTKNDEALIYLPNSTTPYKNGFGSSAAITVAAVKGMLGAFSEIDDIEVVHKLSQLAHSIATGKVGSGFDIAAATYGSLIYTRYSPEIVKKFSKDYSSDDIKNIVHKKWDYSVEKMEMPSEFILASGGFMKHGTQTTSSINKMREFQQKDPKEYSRLITEIDKENRLTIKEMKKISKTGADKSLDAFVEHFDGSRKYTKRLGEMMGIEIESDKATKIIMQSKQNGALVAKLPGAGGTDAITALCLGNKEREDLNKFWKDSAKIMPIDVKIGNSGTKTI